MPLPSRRFVRAVPARGSASEVDAVHRQFENIIRDETGIPDINRRDPGLGLDLLHAHIADGASAAPPEVEDGDVERDRHLDERIRAGSTGRARDDRDLRRPALLGSLEAKDDSAAVVRAVLVEDRASIGMKHFPPVGGSSLPRKFRRDSKEDHLDAFGVVGVLRAGACSGEATVPGEPCGPTPASSPGSAGEALRGDGVDVRDDAPTVVAPPMSVCSRTMSPIEGRS